MRVLRTLFGEILGRRKLEGLFLERFQWENNEMDLLIKVSFACE